MKLKIVHTNPENRDLDLTFLRAEYGEESYPCNRVTGALTGNSAEVVIHFLRENEPVQGELNSIILTTNCLGKYGALGISEFRGNKPVWHNLGDDLELEIDRAADELIRHIPDLSQLDNLARFAVSYN